jgi:hypothetical protein
MMIFRALAVATLLVGTTGIVRAGDEVLDALIRRAAYKSTCRMRNNRSTLLLSSSDKKNGGLAALLPDPLPGWKADRAQSTAVGAVMFGASVASRSYSNAQGDNVEVQITGDSAMVMQFATLLNNPQIAGAMGKLVRVGSQRAIQTADGDVNMASPTSSWCVQGSGSAGDKAAFAQAVDIIKLTKM